MIPNRSKATVLLDQLIQICEFFLVAASVLAIPTDEEDKLTEMIENIAGLGPGFITDSTGMVMVQEMASLCLITRTNGI